MTATTWSDVQRRAAVPGSAILTQWRANRQAQRAGISNVTYSQDVMEMFGAAPAAAGVTVTPTSAMRVSAVFACVRLIAGAISTMPAHVYQNTTDGRDRVDDALWWLLNEQPCDNWTAAAMWEAAVADMLLRESGFVFIGRDLRGNPREFIKLPWAAVHTELENTGRAGKLIKYFVRDVDRNYQVDAADMLHFPGFGFDGERAMSVISWAARNATGTALAMDEYAGKFFANGSHHSIVIQSPGKMGQEQITNLQAMYAAKYSGLQNAHRLPLVLTEGNTAKEVSINASDAQLLESRRFQVADIARAFGVPPHMIGETSSSTSWGTGLEQMAIGFVRYTLQPHLARMQQELNRKLYPRSTRRFIEFNRDAALQGDSVAEANAFKAALGGPGAGPGYMTVDEIRKLKNLPPLGGRAATVYDPRDMAAAAAPAADPTTEPEPQP
jgi:HK97 family phage portal protein